MNPSVCQRFRRRLPAKRNIFELPRKLPLHVGGSTEHQAVGNTGNARQSANAAFTPLNRLPNRFATPADRRRHANARYHDATIF
jgi:hypothetical protein